MPYIEFDKIDGLYTEKQRRVAAVVKDLFPTVRLTKLDSLHPAYDPNNPFAVIDEPHMLPLTSLEHCQNLRLTTG